LPDHVLLYHFHLGHSKEAALQLDLSSGGSFTHNSISEGKAILEKILENAPYTGIYDEFPRETIESGPDQQKEAYAAEYKIPSNPSYDLVAIEPPIQGTHHTPRDDEPHPFTYPFEFEDDHFFDAELGNTLEPPISTSSHALNSYMRHQGKFKDEISNEPMEEEPIHIEAISILSLSMPAFNVPSKSVLDPRGELMSISLTTMTYPSSMEGLNCHKNERAPPETEGIIDEHGSYFLTIPSNPCSYEKSPKSICNSAITCQIYNPFLIFVHKNFKRVVVDTFVYHKFYKFHGVLA
jgi:hypothetical protein